MRVELRQLFPTLFPTTVRGAELSEQALAEPLFPDEASTIVRAVDKRKVEFALGRTAARRALAELGVPPVALPQLPDRSVAWPDGAWGSITHADGICIAIAALRRDHGGIGIDAEVRERVRRDLWRHIATERELGWLESAPHETVAAARATLLFSAKEAFYKAQFCVSRAWVGFQDAELTFDAGGSFEVRLLVDVVEAFERGQRFEGRYGLLEQHVVTGLVLPPSLAP